MQKYTDPRGALSIIRLNNVNSRQIKLFCVLFLLPMRNQIDISLARFLMIFSLALLAVLEYLWLHNAYTNAHRDMEDQLTHVMFSNMRDVEDSLIFSRLSAMTPGEGQSGKTIMNYFVSDADSSQSKDNCPASIHIQQEGKNYKLRHPARGMLLKEIVGDSAAMDSPAVTVAALVMRHMRQADSTGELAGYSLITWQGNDTVIREAMSRPQFDVFTSKKMALINPSYKADIFHELLPHMSFALFLWIMVAAAFYYIWVNLRKQIQLNALRDEFVSNITHELKTPITTVGVALESLHMSGDLQNTQSHRYLDIGRSELARLSFLVDRILNSRSPQVNYEKLDIKKVLEEVMHRMKVQFDNRHADVDLHVDGDGFLVSGDKAHMSGVFYNLFDNALKYSQGEPVIQVNLTKRDGDIKLDIEDQGIGIPPEYHDKIFEKLFRVPQQNRHDVKGHGLGLSYVADVIRQHHGQIGLVSVPGQGSTFTMTLPVWHEN